MGVQQALGGPCSHQRCSTIIFRRLSQVLVTSFRQRTTSLHTVINITPIEKKNNNKKPIVLFTGAVEQACMDTYRPALNTLTLSRGEFFCGKDIIMIQTGSLKFTDPKRRDLPICETPISREVESTRKKERKPVFGCVCVSLYVCSKHSNSLHSGWMEACWRWGLGVEGIEEEEEQLNTR